MSRGIDDYTRGLIDGVAMFAYSSSESWAENGVKYVGTTGKTLREAVREILREQGYSYRFGEDEHGQYVETVGVKLR